jgi:hypothetical protein
MLDLLPRKEFAFTHKDTVIKGQFGLWAVKRFCDKNKLTLSQLGERLSVDKVTFDDTCQVLLCAVEYKCRTEKKPFMYDDVDACEWIESLGGFGGDDYISLMKHSSAEEPDEKKNHLAELNG